MTFKLRDTVRLRKPKPRTAKVLCIYQGRIQLNIPLDGADWWDEGDLVKAPPRPRKKAS